MQAFIRQRVPNVLKHAIQCNRANVAASTICGFSTSNSTPKLVVETAKSFNPYFNLAYEEWLFDRALDSNTHILYLWRNDPTIVIGRHQNPWKEINIAAMEEAGVNLLRRTSGGGAVYQDHGNTCFTFISPRHLYDPKANTQILTNALAEFGVQAEASGRNDMIANGAKFSGSAYRLKKDRAFHHGTLLINADLSALGALLNPSKAKLLSKGVTSVKARVTNLSEHNPDITHETLSPKIIEAFARYHGADAIPTAKPIAPSIVTDSHVRARFEELQSYEWKYGMSPSFSHNLETRFDWGIIDAHIDVDHNSINDVRVFSDCLTPAIIDHLNTTLVGKQYNAKGIQQACQEAKARVTPEQGDVATLHTHLDQACEFLAKNL